MCEETVSNALSAMFGGFLGGLVNISIYCYLVFLQSRKINRILVCPHGFEDWDNCPDCSH